MARLTLIAVAMCVSGCGGSSNVAPATNDRLTSVGPTAASKHREATASPPLRTGAEEPGGEIEVEEPSADAPVTAAAIIAPSSIRPGELTTLLIRVRIAPGWHIYGFGAKSGPAQPTQFTVTLPDEVTTVGEWQAPPPASRVSSLGIDSVYEADVVFKRQLAVADAAAPNTYQVPLQFHYQACDHARCMAPRSMPLTASLNVVAQRE